MTKTTAAFSLLSLAVLLTAGSIFFVLKVRSNSKSCPLPDYSSSYHGSIEDLFILKGDCVVPSAIEAIKDRSLPRRPFIISFLGNGSYKDALDPLINIANDESDPDRGPAMIAIFQIDNEKGRELAKKYQNEGSDLGKISRDILVNKDYLHRRRSYWQALRSYIADTFAL